MPFPLPECPFPYVCLYSSRCGSTPTLIKPSLIPSRTAVPAHSILWGLPSIQHHTFAKHLPYLLTLPGAHRSGVGAARLEATAGMGGNPSVGEAAVGGRAVGLESGWAPRLSQGAFREGLLDTGGSG